MLTEGPHVASTVIRRSSVVSSYAHELCFWQKGGDIRAAFDGSASNWSKAGDSDERPKRLGYALLMAEGGLATRPPLSVCLLVRLASFFGVLSLTFTS
ncbi:hypothetical protein TIFTF001_012711 [Ficus carica]|uniref:Uncharacterized protein n=1 Tax=Ficus carica TaxID=3494 RepID=A0AA88ACT6_FICCA|nr:hypothetical protein TIFTF001_012711 [Ficus carica]